jgi:hypothetical protein
MTKPDDKEPTFKVVDKRRFDEEGHERPESEASADKEDAKKAPFEPEANMPPRPPISFSIFIQSLAHQAMMGLGIVPWPDSGIVRKDLPIAKETIDLLQMLKDKTANNLDKDEEALLKSVIYQLQIAFVEISKEDKPVGGGSIIT